MKFVPPKPCLFLTSILLILLLWGITPERLQADLSDFGPYPVGTATVTVTRPNSSTFTALLYYPATVAGASSPLDASGGPYSAITFGHGFLQVPTRYDRTMSHLASYGHIVIASNSETGLFPSHSNFANDMRHTLSYLESRNANASDEFFGKVDVARFGLFGHSMGGGAGLLAAAADSRIRAYVGLAAAITNPSPVPQMPNIRVPIALMTGDQDGIVNYTTNSVPMYNAGLAPKQLPLIQGGFHVGFQDDPYPVFPDSGSMPRETQLAITRAYLTSFFGLYLRSDQSLWRNIWGPDSATVSGLSVQSQTGIGLSVDQPSKSGSPGGAIVYEVTLTNSGPQDNLFQIFAEENNWDVSFSEVQTPVLSPGQQHVLMVTVDVPANAQGGQMDALLLSARSQNDGGTRAFCVLNSEALAQPALLNSRLFHSNFSGEGSEDWGRIDSVKSVILAGAEPQTLDLNNISTNVAGINGLTLDLLNLESLDAIEMDIRVSPEGAFSASEFPIANWESGPVPSSVSLYPKEGMDGSSRVLLQWPDGAIENRYLMIRLTSLEQSIADLVIGHLRGEQTQPTNGMFAVTFGDLAEIRASVGETVGASNPLDVDKNGVVTFADISTARTNVGAQLTQITVSIP